MTQLYGVFGNPFLRWLREIRLNNPVAVKTHIPAMGALLRTTYIGVSWHARTK